MRWKWILFSVFTLILALGAGGYLYVSTYDFNRLKPLISEKFKDLTGRKLTIGGDIRIKMGLVPALAFEDISIQNAEWGTRPEMVRVRVLEAQIALFSLFKKRLELEHLVLLEPDILIERSKEGRSNFDFLMQERREGREPSPETQNRSIKRPLFLFRQAFLEKGSIVLKDNGSGKSHRILIERFSSRTRDHLSPLKIRLDGSYKGRKYKIEGSTGPLMGLMDPLRPWAIDVVGTLEHNSVVIEGSIMDVSETRGLRLSVALSGPSIRNIARVAGIKGLPDLGPYTGHFLVTDVGGRVKIKDLNMKLGTSNRLKVEISGSVEDPRARKGLSVHFLVQGARVITLTQTFKAPRLPFRGPFTIQGDLADQSPKRYRLTSLKARFGKNDLSGSLKINLSRKHPEIAGSLSSKMMDLRPFFPKRGSRHKVPGTSSQGRHEKRIFPRSPFRFPNLERTDLDLRIKARRLLLRRIALVDLSSNLRIKAGRVTIKDLRSSVGGGALSMSFESKPAGQTRSYSANLSVDQLDLKVMLKELGIHEALEGRLKAHLDLAGTGNSVADLVGGLNGGVTLSVDKGRFDNKKLKMFGTEFATTALRLFNPFDEEKEYSEINCFVSHFDIKDGLAGSKVFVLDTDYVSLIGSGKLNLKTEELDFSVKPIPKKGIGVKGVGRLSISMGELAKPLKLGGTLAQPSLAVDPARTAVLLGKALGGIALFGPVGIAAVLAGGSLGDDNPCLAALKKIEKAPVQEKKKQAKEKVAETREAGKDSKTSVKKIFENIGRSLKGLFKK